MGEKMDWNDNQMTRPSYAINDDMELESSEASQHSDDNCAKKIYATEFPAWVLKRLNATKKSKPSNLLLQMNGENLTVLFSWVDKSFAIVLNNENTRRRPKDLDSGLVPRDPIYDSLRTKMINLPRNMWFGRIVIDATTNGELEDTFVESLVMKKWICQTFELNISAKFTRSALVARLIRTLNPAEITINLQSGSFFSSQNSGEKFGENERMANGHVHVLVHRDNLATFEPDAIELMKTMVKNDLKMTRNGDTCGSEAATSYSIELGHALKYGREMLQTLLAIQQLFKSIVEMAINSGCRGRFSLKKLIIRRHRNTHQVKRSANPPTKKEISMILSTYFVKSGKPVFEVEKKEFQELVLSILSFGELPESRISEIIPGRTCVTDDIRSMCNENLAYVAEWIGEYINNGLCNLIADYGKVHHDILSLKVSVCVEYWDEALKRTKWSTLIIPISAAIENNEAKNSQNIYALMVKVFSQYGWSESNLKRLSLTADGGTNLKKVGDDYLFTYIRCLAHLTNIIAQRIFKPYSQSILNSEDKKICQEFEHMIQIAGKLASTFNRKCSNKLILGFSLPSTVETRWFSQYENILFISEKMNILVGNANKLDEMSKEHILWLNERRNMMETYIQLIRPLYDINVASQADEMFVGLVIPIYCGFLNHFLDNRESNNSELCSLARSGLDVLSINSRDISQFHCLATILNPQSKKIEKYQTCFNMCSIDLDVMVMAHSALKELESALQLNIQNSEPPPKKKSECVSFLEQVVNDMMGDTITGQKDVFSEFSEYLVDAAVMEYDEYWNINKTRFPNLYVCAKKLFSMSVSEATCERSFSLYKNMFRSNRQSMDPIFLEKLLLMNELSKLNIH